MFYLSNRNLKKKNVFLTGSFNSSRPTPPSIPIDESFKIHLKTQNSCLGGNNGEMRMTTSNSAVTSSASKTPSPGTSKEDPGTRMDKFCQVNNKWP